VDDIPCMMCGCRLGGAGGRGAARLVGRTVVQLVHREPPDPEGCVYMSTCILPQLDRLLAKVLFCASLSVAPASEAVWCFGDHSGTPRTPIAPTLTRPQTPYIVRIALAKSRVRGPFTDQAGVIPIRVPSPRVAGRAGAGASAWHDMLRFRDTHPREW